MIAEIQEALRSERIDAWVFSDHHRRDPFAYRILGLPATLQPSRRWFYVIPAESEPIKIVHRIESSALNSLPGEKMLYAAWLELNLRIENSIGKFARVAMQYSPNCNIPSISTVDAGTVDLIRSFVADVVSSANLIQLFEARWTDDQYEGHKQAGKLVDSIRSQAFQFTGECLRASKNISEYDVQTFILESFQKSHLVTDHGPIVAVNKNASDPHYEPSRDRHSTIKFGDLLLIDLWAKLASPHSVYYDVTWTGFCGNAPPVEMERIFQIVRQSRVQACDFVKEAVAARQSIEGWQVDDVARGVINNENLGEYFFHRTGHSIGTDVHGAGANMDNLESHDERRITHDTCFSIEPGIYLPEFGIRSEVNVFVGRDRATVTGEEQDRLIVI